MRIGNRSKGINSSWRITFLRDIPIYASGVTLWMTLTTRRSFELVKFFVVLPFFFVIKSLNEKVETDIMMMKFQIQLAV